MITPTNEPIAQHVGACHDAVGPKAVKGCEKQRKLAIDLYRGKQHTIAEICQAVGITKSTLYAYLKAEDG